MVEKARYQVVRRVGKVEVREYGPLVVARVRDRGNPAFYHLFRFISGDNRQRSKVAMTAPVIQEREGGRRGPGGEEIPMTAPVIGNGDHMAFVMPEGYTLESTPEPLDPRVTIEELPARHLAVLRFSGRWTESAFDRRSRQLLEALEGAGIRPVGDVMSMVYNPPFTPPFLRRNEVAVEVLPPAGEDPGTAAP